MLEPVINTESNYPKGSRVGLKDFDFIRCVGMGGFSKVYLVRERSTCQYYAMKLIEKKSI
jgi:serum/glucocorticoid-regulated kinase 2